MLRHWIQPHAVSFLLSLLLTSMRFVVCWNVASATSLALTFSHFLNLVHMLVISMQRIRGAVRGGEANGDGLVVQW